MLVKHYPRRGLRDVVDSAVDWHPSPRWDDCYYDRGSSCSGTYGFPGMSEGYHASRESLQEPVNGL